MISKKRERARIKKEYEHLTKKILARSKIMYEVEKKFYAVVNPPCKEIDGDKKIVYTKVYTEEILPRETL